MNISCLRQRNFDAMKKYTDLIDEILFKRKLSRAWLADELNVTRQALNRYFKQDVDGTLPTHYIDRINQIFAINLYDLRQSSQEPPQEVAESPAVYERTITMDPREIQSILIKNREDITTLRQELEKLRETLQSPTFQKKGPGRKRDNSPSKKR